MNSSRFPFLALLTLTLSATAPALRAQPEGHETWTQHCSRCHGPDGKGQTKMGRKLKVKDLTAPRLQTRMTDHRILEAIAEGDRDNEGNERMPSFREKLSEAERNKLVSYIRTLGANQSSTVSAE